MTNMEKLKARHGFLTVAEVAEVLGYQPNTIYRWIKKKSLPHFRVGANVKFDPVQLGEYLQSRGVGA